MRWWLVFAGLAGGFLAVSWYLGVTPGRPIAVRSDVFFQSDAGSLVTDATTNFDGRARGTHPLIYPLWTRPLHTGCKALSPAFPPDQTAALGSRILIAVVAAGGLTLLSRRLWFMGVPSRVLILFSLLAVFGNGQTLAALPDHFGLSVGILSLALTVALSHMRLPRLTVSLLLLTLLAGGITITNAIFPLGLLLWRIRQTASPRGRRISWIVAVAGLIGGIAAGLIGLQLRPDIRERLDSRVGLYLNWRLTDAPDEAAVFTVRGIIDAVTAPTPVVSSEANMDRLPMLTYEPPGQRYRLWPYDGLQSAGAVAWLTILMVGTRRALREPDTRGPALFLWGWTLGNAAFHNVWGDEYFLYTPHYAWTLLTVAALGWRRGTFPVLALLTALTLAAALYTLQSYRRLLDTIPA